MAPIARRRDTAGRPAPPAALRVHVLGAFEVEGVPFQALGSRKARTLLKCFALARGHAVPVDRLVDVLWPDAPPASPEEQISVLVSRLRGALGAARLPRTGSSYALIADWLDLDAAAQLVAEAAQRLAAGSVATARSTAEAALHLLRGPLLPDEPDAAWLIAERTAVERLTASAHHTAAQAALTAGDYAGAAEHAAAALDQDPYDEVSLRLLMRAHTLAGRPSSALADYARVRERLVDDLAADPDPETEALHLAILRQEPLPTAEGPTAPRAAGAPAAPRTSRRPPDIGSPGVARTIPAGREREIATLDAVLEEATAGRFVLLVVEGEAGIGKTHLLDAWASSVRTLVLRARGDEIERSLPLQPLFDAFDSYLRTLPSARAVLDLLGPDHALLAPFLPTSPPAPRPAPPDPATGQVALFTGLLALAARLAAQQLVTLVLDDLHLADRATLDWLHFVARRAPGLRLLVIGAARPEEQPALPDARRLPLGPLDLAAVRRVLGPNVDAARATALHARSAGHPLFLLQIADATGVTGTAAVVGEKADAVAASPESLPAALRDFVVARCERAGPAVANTLRTAALLGPAIDLDLVAAVLDQPALEVLAHIEDGARRHLLEERDGAFAFHHEIVREALAASAGAPRRALVHRQAGRLLASREDASPLRIAYHARLGGDLALAAVALGRASSSSSARYDHAESERLLDEAIAFADSAELRLQRARTRNLLGDYKGAEADALAALERGAGPPALETAAWAAYYRRDLTAANRYAEDGASLGDDATRARCVALTGRLRCFEGDLAGAEASFALAIELQSHLPDGRTAEVWLAQARCWQGRPEEALTLTRRARHAPAAGVPDRPSDLLYAFFTRTHALAMQGRADDALREIAAWEAELAHQHAVRRRGRPPNFRAWVLRGLGDLSAADESNQAALELIDADEIGVAEHQIQAMLDLAGGRLRAGDPSAAAAQLEQAEALIPGQPVMRWRHALRAGLLRTQLALAGADTGAAAEQAALVRREATRLGAGRHAAIAAAYEAEAAARRGTTLNLEDVGAALAELPRVAGLEAWWLTARVARAARSDRLAQLAAAQAAQLALQAGERGAAFARYAAAELDRAPSTSTRGRQG